MKEMYLDFYAVAIWGRASVPGERRARNGPAAQRCYSTSRVRVHVDVGRAGVCVRSRDAWRVTPQCQRQRRVDQCSVRLFPLPSDVLPPLFIRHELCHGCGRMYDLMGTSLVLFCCYVGCLLSLDVFDDWFALPRLFQCFARRGISVFWSTACSCVPASAWY